MKNKTTTPKLDAPGAGIPFYQKVMLKLFVAPLVANRTEWAVSEERFHKITSKILKEIEGLDEKQLSLKVLVPPQSGLEDSSRYWSIAMTLEHLVIVGTAVMAGIESLGNGQVPETKVDTAKVKPLGVQSPQQSLTEFRKFSIEDYPKFVTSLSEATKTSKVKHYHPWFGPLNVKQWFWLISIHQGIHLKQIRAIKKGGGVLR